MFAVIVLWIVLNRWVLPRFGIATCMSGGCAPDRRASCGPKTLTPGVESVESKGDKP